MKRTLIMGMLIPLLAFLPTDLKASDNVGEAPDYKNSIKLTFLSWFSGSTKLSYERAFSKWNQSGEICASLISAGYDKYHNDPMGFTLRYGHKFFLGRDEISLKGFYLRPEFVYSRSLLSGEILP